MKSPKSTNNVKQGPSPEIINNLKLLNEMFSSNQIKGKNEMLD